MQSRSLSGIAIIVSLVLLAGCMESPVKEPIVTVTDVAVSDLSLQTMTVNTTVNIFNPNPVGADLRRVAFSVWYLDDTPHYLGHGEQSNITVKGNGNTSVSIPVRTGTIDAAQAVGSLVRNGNIRIRVNGSAAIDLRVTTFEKPFEQTREFTLDEFEGIVPAIPRAGISIIKGIRDPGGLTGSVSP